MGLMTSFKKNLARMRVKIGDEAMIKLLTPAVTLTEPVVNKYEYKKTPERPLSANIGRSFSFGSLLFFITPMIQRVSEAMANRRRTRDTGL
jgi:hypothetical protein